MLMCDWLVEKAWVRLNQAIFAEKCSSGGVSLLPVNTSGNFRELGAAEFRNEWEYNKRSKMLPPIMPKKNRRTAYTLCRASYVVK